MQIAIDFFGENLIKAVGAGVYMISVRKSGEAKPLYIGESVFMLVRCAYHLFTLKGEPSSFGFTDETINDDKAMLSFSILAEDDNSITRKEREKVEIRKQAPLCQSGISDRMKAVEDRIEALSQFLSEFE